MQFDGNEHFPLFELSSAAIKISASESITWVGLNSNKVWLMKSLASEMGLRGEKRFSVTTLLNCKLMENDFTCIARKK